MSPCKGFLGGLHISTFLSTHQEWHALLEGFGDGFCPWKARYEPDKKRKADIAKEHHYYNIGRPIGFGLLIWFVSVMIGALI